MTKKSPAFQFYPKDWFSSRNVRRMTLEQRGGYWELLCHEWLEDDCSLPDDDDELAFLSGLNDKWPECSKNIRKCFEKRGKKLFNLRLLEEREKQEAFRKKCSDAGRKSGEVRRNKDLEPKVGATIVQPKDEGTLNSSSSVCSLQSSSSIASSKEKDLKDIVPFKDIISHLNGLLDTHYRHTSQKTQSYIKARWNEGYRLDDFMRVHEIKHAEWKDSHMAQFLRPETLYGNKFESYLNQKETLTKTEQLAKDIKEAFE